MGVITIYYKKTDEALLKELHKYAEDRHWSVSLAIMQIVKQSLGSVETMPIAEVKAKVVKEKKPIDIKKVDPETFFAEMESKVVANQGLEDCIAEHMINGSISCYFRDNGREYRPYCKKDCWPREDIWHERAVK